MMQVESGKMTGLMCRLQQHLLYLVCLIKDALSTSATVHLLVITTVEFKNNRSV